uniref:Uncharacterized protein n=1 Tax=Picea glauca TaxID=3330 RepID=A0A101M041_PICGL|nr:hypothetical protein ABT39_MTgene4569 [Picea glauca]QHR91971.1 hypothetical protein Q903MT_gene6007 [Picea sitchensis]
MSVVSDRSCLSWPDELKLPPCSHLVPPSVLREMFAFCLLIDSPMVGRLPETGGIESFMHWPKQKELAS